MDTKKNQLSLREAGQWDQQHAKPAVGWSKISSDRHKAGVSRKARIKLKKESAA